MSILNRYRGNPILIPDPNHAWEAYATFNGSITKKDNRFYLLYRAMSQDQVIANASLRLSTIGVASSDNGFTFDQRKQLITPEFDWERFGCEDPRVTYIDGQYIIFYTALSLYPPRVEGIKVAVAISKDLEHIQEKHLVTPFNAKGMTMFPEKINGMYTVLVTIHTDAPPAYIAIAQFETLETLWDEQFWNDWHEHFQDHLLPLRRVSSDQVEVGAPPIKTEYGWVFIYSYIRNYFGSQKEFRIEACLLDLENPTKVIGRIEDACLVPQEDYELNGQIQNVVFPEGVYIEGNMLNVYYGAADSSCCVASSDKETFMSRFAVNAPVKQTCTRFNNNPLLKPLPEHEWESTCVFNPAVLSLEGKTYIIYRASDSRDVSTIGCAISNDGLFIDERLSEPIYIPRIDEEINRTGSTGGGCEDPRITLINDTIYLCYTAYDGILPRLALAHISVTDFLARSWTQWSTPKIISQPGVGDKDGCLFPELVNGKYVFFHRIEPNIVIDLVDDLEFIKKPFLESTYMILPEKHSWDSVKIGINTPPLKTKEGWLTFYHGISEFDHGYRLGALLLDLNDVSKVIARTIYPILEPELPYEKYGVVNNVVFPCGFTLKDDTILLYYGGADSCVAGASIKLSSLLSYLLATEHKQYLKIH